jgi:hypothetical protein
MSEERLRQKKFIREGGTTYVDKDGNPLPKKETPSKSKDSPSKSKED